MSFLVAAGDYPDLVAAGDYPDVFPGYPDVFPGGCW